ncbi:JAB1/Mov34/MPN/PAD-1 ubiquitin protease-domain-containing protein [Pavlovales sp. CCMP2436]|nr:JAB1/Mov34/MPN/PAD-1 ubiquitin protease-domain-containing protein [Pavlovales sp. CCMP2436]
MASAGSSGAENAQKRWELENNIEHSDKIYRYDNAEHQRLQRERPWKEDPKYFKHVRISALALIKMVMHARAGGTLEVIGVMQGKIDPDDPKGPTMIVMDVFPLPVEGTETRVNPMADAYEYMVGFSEACKTVGRHENMVGWYHSHPGYGCWMSGIDCMTQMTNQRYQEPFLAIVVDPIRTCSTGKVEIGAFRTYPEGYKPPEGATSEYQSIPLNKIEDFGVHQNSYYQLDISYFKSSTDASLLSLLWNKYWISTLSSSTLVANQEYLASQVGDLAAKLEQAEGQLVNTNRSSLYLGSGAKGGAKAEESQLSKICRDSSKLTRDHVQGLMSQIIKNTAFNTDSS